MNCDFFLSRTGCGSLDFVFWDPHFLFPSPAATTTHSSHPMRTRERTITFSESHTATGPHLSYSPPHTPTRLRYRPLPPPIYTLNRRTFTPRCFATAMNCRPRTDPAAVCSTYSPAGAFSVRSMPTTARYGGGLRALSRRHPMLGITRLGSGTLSGCLPLTLFRNIFGNTLDTGLEHILK